MVVGAVQIPHWQETQLVGLIVAFLGAQMSPEEPVRVRPPKIGLPCTALEAKLAAGRSVQGLTGGRGGGKPPKHVPGVDRACWSAAPLPRGHSLGLTAGP